MKRVWGFLLFCVALGMVLMFFIANKFLGLLIAGILMVVGYLLFSSC